MIMSYYSLGRSLGWHIRWYVANGRFTVYCWELRTHHPVNEEMFLRSSAAGWHPWPLWYPCATASNWSRSAGGHSQTERASCSNKRSIGNGSTCDSKSILGIDMPGTAGRDLIAFICGGANIPLSKNWRLWLTGVRGRTKTLIVGDVAGGISTLRGLHVVYDWSSLCR